jgi:hypothetical protein
VACPFRVVDVERRNEVRCVTVEMFVLFLIVMLPNAFAKELLWHDPLSTRPQTEIASVQLLFDQTAGEFVEALNRKDDKAAEKLADTLKRVGVLTVLAQSGKSADPRHEIGEQFEQILTQYFDAILKRRITQAHAAVQSVEALHHRVANTSRFTSGTATRLGCFSNFMTSTYLAERIKIETDAAAPSNFDAYGMLREISNSDDLEHISATATYGANIAKAIFRILRPSDSQYGLLQHWIGQTIGHLHMQAKRENQRPSKSIPTIAEFLVYTDLGFYGRHEYRNSHAKEFAGELFVLGQDAVRAFALGQRKLADAKRETLLHLPKATLCENLVPMVRLR